LRMCRSARQTGWPWSVAEQVGGHVSSEERSVVRGAAVVNACGSSHDAGAAVLRLERVFSMLQHQVGARSVANVFISRSASRSEAGCARLSLEVGVLWLLKTCGGLHGGFRTGLRAPPVVVEGSWRVESKDIAPIGPVEFDRIVHARFCLSVVQAARSQRKL